MNKPEIAISPATDGIGWIILIDNSKVGSVFLNKDSANTTAEWLADLFDLYGAPLILGGKVPVA